ncbi:DUF3048 domain-containing protein [Alkalihalobacillus sp. CinArs1]|uniref:DUF3048 domain-containing protein n=1 Tax=Alkalihalobacillus sp. CinArs1 TaxID=2995314 RepID=UPI0022DD8CA4|nr:DUF3048 domain-containing protein [Alkalihalobacillus sp. CinArs1]
MGKLRVSLAVILSVGLLAGCSQKDTAQKSGAESAGVEEPSMNKEVDQIQGEKAPLTGVATENSDQRVISVVVNNHPKARPQSGLHKADIVYEMLVEGKITRLLAIYQSDYPDIVGPVRSARDYFIELSAGFNGIFVAHGYSPSAQAILNSGAVDHLNGMQYDGTLFERASFRKAPHNSYITTDSIKKGATDNGYELMQIVEPLTFGDKELVSEEKSSVAIGYSNTYRVAYRYNDGVYKRFLNDELMEDRETKEPISLENVLIVEANHHIIDDYGRRAIDIESGGEAILLQEGVKKEVKWKNENGRITAVKDGSPVPLVPGRTWVNIVPDLTMITSNQ